MLDIDGVLNSHRFFRSSENDQGGLSFGTSQLDPQALGLLDRLVEGTGARIVVSSSWRHIWDWQEIARMFAERGFRNPDRIIGQTPDTGDGNRGAEIREWFALHAEGLRIGDGDPVTSWAILDDTDEFDTEQHQHFVRVNPATGLAPDDVRKAASILGKE